MLVPKPAIQGQDHETASPSDRNPDPDGKPHPRPAGRNGPKSDKGFLRLRMHHLRFLAFTLVTGTPIAMLAIWEARASVQNEVASVNVRHLLVARTLASTMSRYSRPSSRAGSLSRRTSARSSSRRGSDGTNQRPSWRRCEPTK